MWELDDLTNNAVDWIIINTGEETASNKHNPNSELESIRLLPESN
jgi:hypothetical protein